MQDIFERSQITLPSAIRSPARPRAADRPIFKAVAGVAASLACIAKLRCCSAIWAFSRRRISAATQLTFAASPRYHRAPPFPRTPPTVTCRPQSTNEPSAWRCRKIDCDIERLDFTQGDQRSADYARLNPNMKMPTLEDDGFVLWESNATLFYFAVCIRERIVTIRGQRTGGRPTLVRIGECALACLVRRHGIFF